MQAAGQQEQQIQLESAPPSRSDYLVHSRDFLKAGVTKHHLFDQDEFRDSKSDANYAFKSNSLLVLVALCLVSPAAYLLAATCHQPFSSIFFVLLFNFLVIVKVSRYAVSYILFPYANYFMNRGYHQSFNERMIEDSIKNFRVVGDLIQNRMNKKGFVIYDTLRDYTTHSKHIAKMCDYINLFSRVNRELINDDVDKEARRKRTARFPISPLFLEVTVAMERVLALVKEIKVVSISQIEHTEGKDKDWDSQPVHEDEGKLLSIFQHFNDLEALERNYKDLREYTVQIQTTETKRRIKNDRSLPLVYKPKGKEQVVDDKLRQLASELASLQELLRHAMRPLKICGKRTSCCCFFTSLYHETKQMGIVLRKSFKGTHLWIPSIEQ